MPIDRAGALALLEKYPLFGAVGERVQDYTPPSSSDDVHPSVYEAMRQNPRFKLELAQSINQFATPNTLVRWSWERGQGKGAGATNPATKPKLRSRL